MKFTIYLLVGIPVLIVFYLIVVKLIKKIWKSDL